MSLRDEFKAFILRGNVVDLAIAVVIGAAFSEIVKALTEGLIKPLVNLVVPNNGGLTGFKVGAFEIGHVLSKTIDFLIIALVIFLVLVKGLGALSRLRKKEEAPAEAPKTKECPECLSEVPVAARRCRHCHSQLGY